MSDFAKRMIQDAKDNVGNKDKVKKIQQDTVNMIIDKFIAERNAIPETFNHTPYDDLEDAKKEKVDDYNFGYFVSKKDELGQDNQLIKDMALEKFILLYNPSPEFENAKSNGNVNAGDPSIMYTEMHNSNHKSMQTSAINAMNRKMKGMNIKA